MSASKEKTVILEIGRGAVKYHVKRTLWVRVSYHSLGVSAGLCLNGVCNGSISALVGTGLALARARVCVMSPIYFGCQPTHFGVCGSTGYG